MHARCRPAMLWLLGLLACFGCGREEPPASQPSWPPPAVESGAAVELLPGQAFHFVDHFKGGPPPAGVAVGGDGQLRIVLRGARLPVVAAPAPYVMRQTLRLPSGGRLRVAFGAAPSSWDKTGAGIRFNVRIKSGEGTVALLSEEVKRWRGEDDTNWSPVTLDIPPSGGEEIELEFETEPLGPAREGEPEDLVAAHAVWLDPAIFVPSREPRPNIVLLVIDALRPDHLGCYGYARRTSPFLDSLAARGVVFEDAGCQATWTLPSLQSLLTSSYCFVRGSRTGRLIVPGEGGKEFLLQPVFMPVSLQGELRAAGYESLACVGGGFLDPALGFDAGFDWYWTPQYDPMLPNQLAVVKERLSAASEAPFFLLLHIYEVHNYFQGWAHCIEQFDRGYLGPLTDPRALVEAALHGHPEELSGADLQYMMDLYDGEILHTDRYLRLFFEWLLSQPWGANTLIVVTADHGEALGGHGVMSHGGVPYQEVVRVPLIMRFPDRSRRVGAQRVVTPVGLVDLMPTLLETAGTEPPAGLVGRSLVPLLGAESLESRPLFCESRGSAIMARREDWCYINSRGEREEELYNLAADPGQTLNVASSSPERLGEMRRVLAGLAMKAARGYRLAVVGPRAQQLDIDLASAAPLAYLDVPTIRERDAISFGRTSSDGPGAAGGGSGVSGVAIRLPPGDMPHVVLFDPADQEAAVTVSVHSDHQALEAERFHLGGRGRRPEAVPVVIGRAAQALLAAPDPPVRTDGEELGVWLWLPPSAARPRTARQVAVEELPEGLTEQLKSLGYLR